jgi:hypothetical protein
MYCASATPYFRFTSMTISAANGISSFIRCGRAIAN